MSEDVYPIYQLLKDDPRYPLEAYQFVRESLAYAQDVLNMGEDISVEHLPEVASTPEPTPESASGPTPTKEHHLSGQQLCEAIRTFAIDQYGYMAQIVLKNWGFETTGDFGNVVYNLINIGWMRKSEEDRREHFDDVFKFDDAFGADFKITMTD